MKYPTSAKRLQEAINNRGISQQDLADMTGINKASISQYINGHHCPTNAKAILIGKALGVRPEWLMGFDVQMRSDEISRRELYNCDAKLIRPSREELMPKDDKPLYDYYIDDDTAQTAQEIFENKDLKLLFEAARTASPEDLKAAQTLLLALKAKEQGRQ